MRNRHRGLGLALFAAGLACGWLGAGMSGPASAQSKLNFRTLSFGALVSLEAKSKPEGVVLPRNAEQLRFRFEISGPISGRTARGVWIAEDIGDAAPPNYTIGSPELDLSGEIYSGAFVLNQPDKGWPAGKYRLEVRLEDSILHTERFLIE